MTEAFEPRLFVSRIKAGLARTRKRLACTL
jgi:hypothetical protein